MFIHFLHHQTVRLYRFRERIRPRKILTERLRAALRWAVFLTNDCLILPTSDLVQSPLVHDLADDLRLLKAADLIYFVGSSVDPETIQQQHRVQFESTWLAEEWARDSARRWLTSFEPNFQFRHQDMTSAVRIGWAKAIKDLASRQGPATRRGFWSEHLIQTRRLFTPKVSPSQYEKLLAAIPERLGDHAFLWRVVEDLGLLEYNLGASARERFERVLAWLWISSYVEEYRRPILGVIPGIGTVDCGLSYSNPELVLNLPFYSRAAMIVGVLEPFQSLTLSDVIRMRDNPAIMLLRKVIEDFAAILAADVRPDPLTLRYLAQIRDAAKRGQESASNAYQSIISVAEAVTRWATRMSTNISDEKADVRSGRAAALTSLGNGLAKASSEGTPSEKKTVLFLAANPLASSRLQLDEEIHAIQNVFHALQYRDRLELKSRWAIQPDDLHDALLRERPIVVHFSGHGTGEPGIVLQGDTESSEVLVSGAALKHLFQSFSGSVRVVVLNACYSDVQASAIAEVIDFVIGVTGTIGDLAARKFAAAFYRGLGFGQSVRTAFELGINALKLSGLTEDENAPTLKIKLGCDPSTATVISPD